MLLLPAKHLQQGCAYRQRLLGHNLLATQGSGRLNLLNTVGRPFDLRKVHDLHSRQQIRTTATSDKDDRQASKSDLKTIPIFPLGIVALPTTAVPLRIFEARYRVLFNTLLAGANGLEEGLINWESPYAGSRSFGMCLASESGLAAIGCMLHIDQHQRLDDGQMLIENTGMQRFQIKKVVQERPVLICEVELLHEDEDESEEAKALAAQIVGLLRDTLSVNSKLTKQQLAEEMLAPKSLDEFTPRELSFWVTSLFRENPAQQQALLQENNTLRRLTAVRDILESTLKYLSAQSALASAFSSGKSGDEPNPPAGGPD